MPWVYTFAIACEWGKINDMVRFLRRGGVDLELRDRLGNTVLQAAINKNGRMGYGVIDKLLEYGANPFIMNDSGETTIHLAANYNNPDLVSRLIDLGVNPDLACTRHGITPLHVAAINGCVDVVRLLINHGVDQSHKDPGMDCEICQRGGWTALDYAREHIRFHDLRITGRFPKLFHLFAVYIHRKWDTQAKARYQIEKMLKVAEVGIDKKLAFAMGHNTRLGEGSMLAKIDPDVMWLILKKVDLETIE